MQYSYALLGLAAAVSAQDIQFTSIFNVTATPDQVISNAGAPAPGPAGARGQFNYAIDSKNDVICYDITLVNFVGAYQSPAKTATHLHEGAKGKAGPPRIAFPNPVGDDALRQISGCLIGPFTTGLKMADNVTDTGAGFRLSQIEANPAGFFTDSHSVLFPAGVVRGQLDQKFEILKPQPVGYPTGPAYPADGYPTGPAYPADGYPTGPAYPADGYPTDPAYPADGYPTDPAYPADGYPAVPAYPGNDGYETTTGVYTKTIEKTISACPTEVVDCPYKAKPYVTKTEEVYTTVCPKSEYHTLVYPVKTEGPGYETKTIKPYPVETHPAYVPGPPAPPAQTYPAGPVVTYPGKPVETYPAGPAVTYPGKPVETHPAGPVVTIQTYPVGKPTPVQSYPAVGTGAHPPYATFTGAAASNKVGGLLIAAGLAAALL